MDTLLLRKEISKRPSRRNGSIDGRCRRGFAGVRWSPGETIVGVSHGKLASCCHWLYGGAMPKNQFGRSSNVIAFGAT
jgi:hypothetical protein